MRFQDQTVRMTSHEVEALFRVARAVPEDKLNWKPMDNGRTVLDQLQECAQSATFFAGLFNPESEQDLSPEATEARKRERQSWTTIDQCEAACNANSAPLYEAIRQIPDERLEETIELPWGETATIADALAFQYWNLVYHHGQINYLQTLYGDFEMH